MHPRVLSSCGACAGCGAAAGNSALPWSNGWAPLTSALQTLPRLPCCCHSSFYLLKKHNKLTAEGQQPNPESGRHKQKPQGLFEPLVTGINNELMSNHRQSLTLNTAKLQRRRCLPSMFWATSQPDREGPVFASILHKSTSQKGEWANG